MVSTTRNERLKPTTDWYEREKPINFIQPLEDATNIVCNEDSQIIYIFANSWKPVAATIWTARE